VLLIYHWLFTVTWIAFFIYWQVMAINTKTTERLEPVSSRALRVLLFAAGIALLSYPFPAAWLNLQLLPQGRLSFWAGFAITVAGLLFCIWARVHLGRNWSRSVTIKQDHELIVTGPYALVRHPIYSGLFAGFIGTGLAVGQVRAVLAFALVVLSFWYKLRLEEKWMREQFGAAYEAYTRRVKAVVPWVL